MAKKQKKAIKKKSIASPKKAIKKIDKRQQIERILGFLSILLFFVFNEFIPDKTELVTTKTSGFLFTVLSFLVTGIIAVSLFLPSKTLVKNILKYTFLVTILYFLAISIINGLQLIEEYPKILIFSKFLILPTGIIGFLSIYFHKEEFQNDQTHSTKENALKYIPILSFFKKEKLWYSIAMVLIVGLSIFVNFKSYDKFEIFEDEYQVFATAEGYYHTGEFIQWDYKTDEISKSQYNGAYIHTWQIAQSFKLFGVSLSSARLVSAFWGVLFTIIALFVIRFFTRSRAITVLTVLSILFFHKYIYFAHYVRMYIVFIPLFLLTAYFIFRVLTEKCIFTENSKFPIFFKEKFNFKFSYLPPIFILLYTLWILHPITLIILPITFLFIIYLTIYFRETKYYILLGISLFVAFIVAYVFKANLSSDIINFFDAKNTEFNKIYIQYILEFPLITAFTITLLLTGISIILFTKDNLLRSKLVFLYLFEIVTLIIFIYVLDYKGIAFRYTSHITLMAIILSSFIFFLQNKILYNKMIQTFLGLFFVVSIFSSFYSNYNDTYVKHKLYGFPSIVFETLESNLKPTEETIFGQYLKYYHLKGDVKKYKVIDMKKDKKYQFNTFITDIQQAKKGWFVWMTGKSYHIDQKILDYIFRNFKQYHGHKFDETLMELYYFDESMLPGTPEYQTANQGVFNTNSYLDLSKSYSISFWLKTPSQTPGVPIFYGNKSENTINLIEKEGSYTFSYNNKTGINTGKVNDDKWHHVVWKQRGSSSSDKFALFVDGKKIGEETISVEKTDTVRLLISLNFQGQMQDMRVFNFELNQPQVDAIYAIYNNGKFTLEEELTAKGKKFSPNTHFTVK